MEITVKDNTGSRGLFQAKDRSILFAFETQMGGETWTLHFNDEDPDSKNCVWATRGFFQEDKFDYCPVADIGVVDFDEVPAPFASWNNKRVKFCGQNFVVSEKEISLSQMKQSEGWYKGTGSRKGYMYYSNGKGLVLESKNEDFSNSNPVSLNDEPRGFVVSCSSPLE